MTYSVRVLNVGDSKIRGPQVFWMSHWDEMLPFALNVAVIRGNNITAIVNTSPPEDTRELVRQFPKMRWLHDHPVGDLRRNESQYVEAALDEVGLRPSDISHVLLTPLELYTTGTLLKFTEAEICMSKKGWLHFHSMHRHPHDVRWRTFSREVLIDLVTDSWDRVRLLEDEDQIASGLRTWWSGGHHRSSMVIEVDTAGGVVAVSDTFFYYENVEDDRLLGLNENLYEVLQTNDRVRRTASHIIPIHDPKVLERYPGGEVA